MNVFGQTIRGRYFNFRKVDERAIAEGREKIEHAKQIAARRHDEERNGERERQSLLLNAKSIVERAAKAGLVRIERSVKFTPPPPDQVRAMAAKFCR